MYRYKLLRVSKGYEGSIFARVGGIYDRRYASNKPQLNFSGFNTREYRGNDLFRSTLCCAFYAIGTVGYEMRKYQVHHSDESCETQPQIATIKRHLISFTL